MLQYGVFLFAAFNTRYIDMENNGQRQYVTWAISLGSRKYNQTSIDVEGASVEQQNIQEIQDASFWVEKIKSRKLIKFSNCQGVVGRHLKKNNMYM